MIAWYIHMEKHGNIQPYKRKISQIFNSFNAYCFNSKYIYDMISLKQIKILECQLSELVNK